MKVSGQSAVEVGLQEGCLVETRSSVHFHGCRKERNRVESLPNAGGVKPAVLFGGNLRASEIRNLVLGTEKDAHGARQQKRPTPPWPS